MPVSPRPRGAPSRTRQRVSPSRRPGGFFPSHPGTAFGRDPRRSRTRTASSANPVRVDELRTPEVRILPGEGRPRDPGRGQGSAPRGTACPVSAAISIMPPTREAITGTPAKAASRRTLPKASYTEGTTSRSRPSMASRESSYHGRNITFSRNPRSAARLRRAGSRGPSPTIRARSPGESIEDPGGESGGKRSAALNGTSLPTNPITGASRFRDRDSPRGRGAWSRALWSTRTRSGDTPRCRMTRSRVLPELVRIRAARRDWKRSMASTAGETNSRGRASLVGDRRRMPGESGRGPVPRVRPRVLRGVDDVEPVSADEPGEAQEKQGIEAKAPPGKDHGESEGAGTARAGDRTVSESTG